jgi:Carboxypeptidase regulatory-like domain
MSTQSRRIIFAVGTLMMAASLFQAAADTAAISGKVTFKGTAPKPLPIDMASSDPKCASMHTEPVLTKRIDVNDKGELKDAFVWIKEGITKEYPAPAEPVMLDQVGCMYKPHVFGLQIGQKLVIKNSDPTMHNIHPLPMENKEFNLAQPVQGMTTEKTFTKLEVAIKVKCDVHPWMFAYCAVVPHPFFAVTGDDGRFTIKNLPAGEYTVQVWHKRLGKKEVKIKVAEGETKTADFVLEPK